jgi:hypothetical protein
MLLSCLGFRARVRRPSSDVIVVSNTGRPEQNQPPTAPLAHSRAPRGRPQCIALPARPHAVDPGTATHHYGGCAGLPHRCGRAIPAGAEDCVAAAVGPVRAGVDQSAALRERAVPDSIRTPTIWRHWTPGPACSLCPPRNCACSSSLSCSPTRAARVLHLNVAKHPAAAWVAQQIVDAFPDDSAPSYLCATHPPSSSLPSVRWDPPVRAKADGRTALPRLSLRVFLCARHGAVPVPRSGSRQGPSPGGDGSVRPTTSAHYTPPAAGSG